MGMLYCGREKTFSESHSTFADKQIQAGYLIRFYYPLIKSKQLKPEKVTSFLRFLSSIKPEEG